MITDKAIFSDAKRLQAHLEGKFGEVKELPESLAEVAFIGRSNSGKSSLLKALLNSPNPPQVSARPGKTRLMFFYRIGAKRNVSLVDFPGYGYAQSSRVFRARFSAMLLDYLKSGRPVRGLFLAMDSRRPLAEEELEIARIAKERKTPLILCLNKGDQLNQAQKSKLTAAYKKRDEFFEILLVSALKRQNLSYLRDFIHSLG